MIFKQHNINNEKSISKVITLLSFSHFILIEDNKPNINLSMSTCFEAKD